MRERNNERSLRESMERYGGKALKFTSPGNNGVPDRLVILPGGRIIMVELKTECGRLSSIQAYQHKKLRELGVFSPPVCSQTVVRIALPDLCYKAGSQGPV